MRTRNRALTLAAGLIASCAHTDQVMTEHVVTLPVKPSIFIRATFDSDPSDLVGSFLPNGPDDGQLDESQAARTQCSAFIKVKRIPAAGQEVDDVAAASSGVAGKLGVKSVAQVGGSKGTSDALRVHYTTIEKLEADVDVKGLADCCAASPADCPDRFINSALMADGHIFAATEQSSEASAEGSGMAKGLPVTGDVEYKDGVKWERRVDFKHQYFAFTIRRSHFQATADQVAAQSASDASCEWANRVPPAIGGVNFVGVSDPSPSEKIARESALRDARVQVIKYLGEFLSSAESSTQTVSGSSAGLSGALDDKETVQSLAQGVARMVKDQKWCVAPQDTIDGQMQVAKVLAFFPNEQKVIAARGAITNLIALRKQQGNLSAAQEKALQDMLEAIK